jgi:hypothetical protein
MEDVLFLALSFLGLMSTRKEQPVDRTVYEDGPFYNYPSYTISGYYDDEQKHQSRRRDREKDRRAEEAWWHR